MISVSEYLKDQVEESSWVIQGIFPPEQYGDYDQLFNLNVQPISDEQAQESKVEQDAYN